MNIVKNTLIQGQHGKPILVDSYYIENNQPKNIVLFCHGYKGFKDWGAWDLVAKVFAENNLFFIKMNFSHNGGTVNQPIDFPDLEAFGNNNFTKELDDIESVINWAQHHRIFENEINANHINLIGHSRGGGTVILKARENTHIKKVISWAGVSDFGSRFPTGQLLENWEKSGVAYIQNTRTNQQMPHYYQFYSNFKENENKFNIKDAVENLNIPYLIIHGTKDETVSMEEAIHLNSWNPGNKILILDNADHTFGCKHPWKEPFLPSDLKKVVENSINFIIS